MQPHRVQVAAKRDQVAITWSQVVVRRDQVGTVRHQDRLSRRLTATGTCLSEPTATAIPRRGAGRPANYRNQLLVGPVVGPDSQERLTRTHILHHPA